MSRLQVEWQENEATLKKLYQQEKEHQNRRRLQAIWYLRQGRTIGETAELLGVHYRTIQDWVAWYRQGGIAELQSHRHGGSRPGERRLTDEQEAELKALAETGEIRTIWDGVQWAEAEYRVQYSYWGLRWVFERLQLRKKVPRQRNPKASEEQQEAWKKGGSGPS
jgi:transposase